MLKFVVVLYRRPDVSTERFHENLRNEHGPMAERLPGLRRYIQNHVFPDPNRPHPGWDAVVELFWDDGGSLEDAGGPARHGSPRRVRRPLAEPLVRGERGSSSMKGEPGPPEALAVYRFCGISLDPRARYSGRVLNDNDDRDCEIRHAELLDQLCAVSRRVARLEASHRDIVELLHDVRDLLRLMAARVRELDGRIDRVEAWRLPLPGRSERIERHLRN